MRKILRFACLTLFCFTVYQSAHGQNGPDIKIWRQDLLHRVNVQSTSDELNFDVLKEQDTRKRIEAPEVIKWLKFNPKCDSDGNPAPITIVGCRNGVFSGQIVISGAKDGFKVAASELTSSEGSPAIPASAVQLRYGLLDGNRRGQIDRAKPWFCGLEEIDADGIVPAWPPCDWMKPEDSAKYSPKQPLWVTVRIPREAKAGSYNGHIKINVNDKNVTVPIQLKVIDWTLPDSKDFIAHVGMFQSPETLAFKYKVDMWSEEHWKLIERSLALLGEIGNDEIFITAINKTHLGNENSMIRYVKQADPGPGGQPVYKPDFSIAERYLDLALKYFGKPPVICLYVWEYTSGHGWHMPDRPADDKFFLDQKETAKITVIDPKSGALSEAELPFWGTEESRAFWKPVVEGMRDILKKRGVEHSLMLGLAGDARPRKITEEDFQTIAPGVKWALQSHPYQEKLWTQPLGLGAFVWGARKLLDKHATELQCGWKPKPSGMIFCHFPRGGFVSASEPEYQRFNFERALASGMNGISRQGGDFWVVDIGNRRPVCLAGRYGVLPGAVSLNSAGNPYWLNPGKHGAVATTGFEMIRENLEECEARVLIESVLTDPAKCAKLDENLKQRCVELLADRVRMILAVNSIFYFTANENKKSVPEFVPVNWQGEMDRLFTLAGEVSKKINPQLASENKQIAELVKE